MRPLLQYLIKKDLDQKTIKQLRLQFLLTDNRWHFFHEGTYCLIRTSRRIDGLERWLKRRGIEFNSRPWDDPHPLVRRY